MSSTNKTTNLNLNKWEATDSPKRSDFIYDNEIIDAVLGGHIQDNEKHLTTADREFFSNTVTVQTYTGNGNSERVITVPSSNAVFVYKSGSSPVAVNEGSVNISFAYAGFAHIANPALALTSKTTICVKNYTSPTGEVINLNTQGVGYVIIAMR